MKKKLTSQSRVLYCAYTLFVFLIVLAGCKAKTQDTNNSPLVLDMVHHNPGEEPYTTSFNKPEFSKKIGYNGKVYFLFESPALAINWESLSSDILPKGSEDREWVDAKAAQIRQMHIACREQNMDIYAMSDLVLFPKCLIEKYNIAETFGNPQDSLTQRLLRIQIAEIFDQFPDLNGLVVRIGETYLHDAPYHKGNIKQRNNPENTIIPLMNLLREEICVKRDKELIFRTWRAFDKNANSYQTINDAVEPHKNLTISIKHCEGDFHRANPFSKIIGQGRHKQIIEVQCAREYEGKGAYPNYIANGVIEGFEEHASMPEEKINSIREFTEKRPDLYAGIWTWSRGGGWGGPYTKNEMWYELNAWVMAKWANDPTQSEEAIFNQYAIEELHLAPTEVPKFRSLCLLSAKAVVRGRNSTHRDMSPWWTRDAGIGWPQPSTIVDAQKQQRNLAQKDESIEIWKEIVQLAEQISWPDDETRTHVIGSSKYGLHLYEIYRSLVYLAGAEEKNDTVAIKQWIAEYDTAWENYAKLPGMYPQVATLYAKDYTRHIKTPSDFKVNELRAQIGM
ncbi:MAG: hypothetical protein ABJG41_00680 [Cyclobacteriaceae bacterium]